MTFTEGELKAAKPLVRDVFCATAQAQNEMGRTVQVRPTVLLFQLNSFSTTQGTGWPFAPMLYSVFAVRT